MEQHMLRYLSSRRGYDYMYKTCLISSDCVSVVLVEEEWLELNVEEVVLDPGQETRAGAVQLGVCETSGKSGHILIRFNF